MLALYGVLFRTLFSLIFLWVKKGFIGALVASAVVLLYTTGGVGQTFLCYPVFPLAPRIFWSIVNFLSQALLCIEQYNNDSFLILFLKSSLLSC